MVKKGLDKAILRYIVDLAPRPVSTREISEKLKIAWHTADRYCLKLQLLERIGCFTIGKATAWYLTDGEMGSKYHNSKDHKKGNK
jgi:DNA-binding IclR family transcriptional regulator